MEPPPATRLCSASDSADDSPSHHPQCDDAMSVGGPQRARDADQDGQEEEESRSLLSDTSDGSDLIVHKGPPPKSTSPTMPGPQRQSSFAQPRPAGTPRTPNRVRFDVADGANTPRAYDDANGFHTAQWVDEEDYLSDSSDSRRNSNAQHYPLLTDIEAPSITVATDDMDFNAEDHLESARPKSNMRNAFMNMANSIIGAGIIGQPYAFKQAGLATGITLLVGLTMIVDWTIRLIVINSKLSGANSFQATVQHCFGQKGLIAISAAQFLFAFGGMVAFGIIVGDSIPHVVVALFPKLPETPFAWILASRNGIIVILTMSVSYPLSLYRDIAKLAKASALALVSMLVILITVITQGHRAPADMKGPIKGSLFINPGVFQAIGVISFAFVCHHNSLLIYGSLKKPTLDRFSRVTHYSTGISMVACMVMALTGYVTFGNLTQGNVLNNFPADNIVVNIARLCFGLNMLTTLPLECFVCREVLTLYYFKDEPFNYNRHLIFTSALVISAMGLSLTFTDLGAVFELVGATSACALAYILPPLCYIKLSTRSWRTYAAGAVVAFGCVVLVISLIQALAKIVGRK